MGFKEKFDYDRKTAGIFFIRLVVREMFHAPRAPKDIAPFLKAVADHFGGLAKAKNRYGLEQEELEKEFNLRPGPIQ